jgi:hypothetical protein
LFRSAAALRRMGARLTRYDTEALTLEACARRLGVTTVVRLSAREDGECTRLHINTERGGMFAIGPNPLRVGRFVETLQTTELPPLTRRD